MLGNNENVFMGMNIFPVDQCKFGKQVKDVEVHPHVALFATRGKASPCLKEVFQPCFMADSKEVFQPCFMADFKEQMFL